MRLDKYLKVSRLIKRRTVANEACDAGRVLVNGKPARASYDVKVGDTLTVQLGARELRAEVLQVSETVRKEEAGELYRIHEEKREKQNRRKKFRRFLLAGKAPARRRKGAGARVLRETAGEKSGAETGAGRPVGRMGTICCLCEQKAETPAQTVFLCDENLQGTPVCLLFSPGLSRIKLSKRDTKGWGTVCSSFS